MNNMKNLTKQQRLELSLSSRHTLQKSLTPSTNPFLILPEEIWLLIINRVNHITLQVLFSTFPELPSHFQKQIVKLQFIQISPRVFEYQPNEKITDKFVSTQLVDENWCLSVCDFLTANPLLKSTGLSDSREVISVHRVVPKLHFYYYLRIGKDSTEIPLTYSTVEEIQEFHQTLKYQPNQPTNLPALTFFCSPEIEILPYLGACVNFFSDYGSIIQNVTFLDFKIFESEQDVRTIFSRFIQCLQSIPNVRSVCLAIASWESPNFEQILRECKQFTKMPNLQKLEIRASLSMQNAILAYFLNGGYFKQGTIKSVILPITYPLKFKCMVEYELTTTFKSWDVGLFRKFLKRQKVKSVCAEPFTSCYIPELFQCLKELPTVKMLKLTDRSATGFHFLRALPSLEHLHVKCSPSTKVQFLESTPDENEPFTTRVVRSYLYREKVPKDINIWEVLPSLKSLTVEEEGVISRHFIRAYKNKSVIFKESIQVVDLD